MSNLITIGSTAVYRDIVQARRGDFRWAIDFFDGEGDSATEQDLAGCTFEFVVLAQDGIAELAIQEVGSGITVSGNNVQIDIAHTEWVAWATGCKYAYYFTKTDSTGFTIELFKGYFTLA